MFVQNDLRNIGKLCQINSDSVTGADFVTRFCYFLTNDTVADLTGIQKKKR